MIINSQIQNEIQEIHDSLTADNLQDCQLIYDYAPYGDTQVRCNADYSDYDIQNAEESAKDEFKQNFENYNNWVFEDDFPNPSKYQKAKSLIIKYLESL